MKRLKYTVVHLLVLFITFPLSVVAQKKDSLTLFKEFVQLSNTYNQMPLFMQVQMKNASNIITSEQDTITTEAKFYLKPEASYIQFGEMEQLVNDSLVVIISNQLQRIIINTDVHAILQQMKSMTGIHLKDSSIMALAKKYSASFPTGNQASIIELNSRDLVYSSLLPKETIQMHYEAKSRKPTKVVSVKRMLMPLEEEDYLKLHAQAGMEKMLLKIEDKGYFLIKEQTTSFIYKAVGHEVNMKIPVVMADRIIKNKDGEFEPVKAYEHYEVTTN